jgi:hypothetical protein
MSTLLKERLADDAIAQIAIFLAKLSQILPAKILYTKHKAVYTS